MAKKTRTKNYKSKKEELLKEVDKSVGYPKKVSNLDNLHSNDPEWYIYDRTMFDSAISMPTLDFKGTKSEWLSEPTTSAASKYPRKYIGSPTVACMYMNPSASTTRATNALDQATSPVNVVARKMYAELSASNAKTSGYAPQDVSTLILALGQIIAYASHLKRAYGITQYYNYYNRTIPRAIMGAYGIDSDITLNKWAGDMAEVRNRLNVQIARINSIQFPANLNYFKKCAYIYNNIFVDREDDMPTFLMMAPYSTWIVDEESYEEGTILLTEQVYNPSGIGISGLIDRLEKMLDKVLTSSTFNYIYADIINLVNRKVMSGDYIHVDPISIDYTIEPLYSEQFNWQFMNATLMGAPNATLTGNYTPNNDVYPSVAENCLKYNPGWKYSTTGDTRAMFAIRGYNRPVRIPNIDVSDDEFVELLAYYNIPYVGAVTSDNICASTCPGISDYYAVSLEVFNGTNIYISTGDYFITNAGLVSDSDVSKVSKLLNIVHAPIMSLVAGDNTEYIVSKLGSYTFVNRKALENLRAQTFLGLFTVK